MLTEKQKRFCQCVAKGMSGKDSYKEVYSNTCKDTTAYTESSKLLVRDDIHEYIQSLLKPLENKVKQDVITERQKKKDIIWERIAVCMERNDDQAVSRYMDILNKMDAEYINVSKDITERPPLDNIDTDTLLKLA